MEPHAANLIRFLTAGVVLGTIFLLRHRQHPYWGFGAFRRYGFSLAGLGLLGYFLYQWMFIIGIDGTTAGNAALIMASAPAWTAIVGMIFGLERLSLYAWSGIILSIIGTGCVILFGTSEISLSATSLQGNLLISLAAVLWGSYTALTKPLLKRMAPLDITFLGFLVALPFLFLLGYPQIATTDWSQVNGYHWIALIYSGALSIGLAVVIWNRAIKEVGASFTAVFGNLVPFVAVIAGNILLNESISFPQLFGGFLIISGLFVVRRFNTTS